MKKCVQAKTIPEETAAKYDLPKVVAQILWNRGIIAEAKTQEDVEAFLNPDYERDLSDSAKLKGMNLACDSIQKTIQEKKKIFIYGDFDVDGVTGSALLFETLKQLEADVSVFIPDREKEGYGLHLEAIKGIKEQGAELLIAIDTGITATKEIDYAKNLGLEVIIVDHHTPPKQLPKCVIINPRQKGDTYPFKELSACALAWKLSSVLLSPSAPSDPSAPLAPFLKWQLDLVGLSTICDVVPLVGENRTLAVYGLKVLQKTKRIGLQKLCEVAGIKKEDIDAHIVGFVLGPRLNAPGRLENADISLELLTTQDDKKALELAQTLNSINLERQELLESALAEARTLVFDRGLNKQKAIVVESKNWLGGIVGLIASKLVQEFNRPTFALTLGEKELKGSARSIEGFHLVEALTHCSECLTRHGGHAKAAGLSLLFDKFENFKERIVQFANEKLSDEDVLPKVNIDSEIYSEELNLEFFNMWLKRMEPFGLGNPRPVFSLTDAKILNARWCGKDEAHLKLLLEKNGKEYSAMAFSWPKEEAPTAGEILDLAVTLDENEWNGTKSLELKLISIGNTAK